MTRNILAAAISAALVAPMAAQAVEFKVSGHINRALRFVDDGDGSQMQSVDNTASRSRVRWVGSGDLGNGMKAGVNLEVGMASNRTGVLNHSTPPVAAAAPAGTAAVGSTKRSPADGGDSRTDIRHSALWFSGTWGKVTMGHTSEAIDGIMFSDLSGTGLADEMARAEHCSGCIFRTSGGGFTGVTNAAANATFDGGRKDILRYDSPALGPATISANVANDEEFGVAVFVNTQLAGGALSAAMGYRDSTNRSGFETWGGSASFRFSQGTSITGGYSTIDVDGAAGDDPDQFYIKLGHKWGNNAASISYGETSDAAGAGLDGTVWGVGFVHTMKKPGVELYAGYHNSDLDAPGGLFGGGVEDIDIFLVGTRVKFQ